jgi:(p)ppGpp synthase/HD superfamily hydrolase
MSLAQKAKELALRAHHGQIRKTGEPFIEHPCAVADILLRAGCREAVVAAGFVHDVLEDTAISIEHLRAELGGEVAAIVAAVTEQKELPWEERKRRYIESVRGGGVDAMAVSAADKIHNLTSVIASFAREGPRIWRRFSRPKHIKLQFERDVLRMMREHWAHPLLMQYERLLEQAEALAN